MSNLENKVPENQNNEGLNQNKKSAPGDGIRSLKTTSLFRAVNFELYVKPNKGIMAIGLASIAFSLGYLLWMNVNYDSKKFYIATREDGSKVLEPKESRWES